MVRKKPSSVILSPLRVRKYREGQSFEDRRGKQTKSENPFSGRPKLTFKNVEEERDYLKA